MTTKMEWKAERSRARFVSHVRDWVRSTGGELCTYANWRGDELEDGDSCGYGSFAPIGVPSTEWTIGQRLYYLPPYCSGSDYSGGSVERSNYRLLLDEYEELGLHAVYGDYGTFAVAVNIDRLFDYRNERSRDLRETFERLANYPCIDDEDVSNLEMELADDDWEYWARSDFERALATHLGVDDVEWDEDVEDGDIRAYFEDWRESANVYWENESPVGMHVDVERVVNGIDTDLDVVPKYGHCKTLRELLHVQVIAAIIGTGVDWDNVKMELEACEWDNVDDEGEVRRVFIGTVFHLAPSGKFWTCYANSNVTQHEAELDSAWWELLESEAEQNGLCVENGEGDPCDVFACEYRQAVIEN